MKYSFHARTFKDRDDAADTFMQMHTEMQELVPNAFMTMSELDNGKFAVLLGCDDDDMDFVEHVEPFWEHGDHVDINMETWMALEARHTRRMLEHVSEDSGEDMHTLEADVRIAPDGSSQSGLT